MRCAMVSIIRSFRVSAPASRDRTALWFDCVARRALTLESKDFVAQTSTTTTTMELAHARATIRAKRNVRSRTSQRMSQGDGGGRGLNVNAQLNFFGTEFLKPLSGGGVRGLKRGRDSKISSAIYVKAPALKSAMKTDARVGQLHVITGPMFAGKTSALLSVVETELAQGRTVFIAKSSLDVRFGDKNAAALKTHDGKSMIGARALHDLETLAPEALEALAGSDVVAIDEAQFLLNLVSFVKRCVEKEGKTVYVAGLDGDYKRERFGDILDLLPMCDTVTRLKGTCSMCGAKSLFSLRTAAATENNERVDVGGGDKYTPACRKCYVAATSRM